MSTDSQANASAQGAQDTDASGASGGSGSAFAFKSEDEFNEKLNRVITARQKDLEKKIDARFGEVQTGLTGFSSKFDELGKALEGLKPKQDDAGGDKGKGKDGLQAIKLEELPEWKAQTAAAKKLEADLAAMRKEADEAKKSRDEAHARNRETTLRTSLADALVKHAGVSSERTKAAIALLHLDEGRIGYSDNGVGDSLIWRGADGEEIALEDGLKKWAKGADAKQFQPAQKPGGTGSGPGRGGGNSNESVDQILSDELAKIWRT